MPVDQIGKLSDIAVRNIKFLDSLYNTVGYAGSLYDYKQATCSMAEEENYRYLSFSTSSVFLLDSLPR